MTVFSCDVTPTMDSHHRKGGDEEEDNLGVHGCLGNDGAVRKRKQNCIGNENDGTGNDAWHLTLLRFIASTHHAENPAVLLTLDRPPSSKFDHRSTKRLRTRILLHPPRTVCLVLH